MTQKNESIIYDHLLYLEYFNFCHKQRLSNMD
jgi:hypothetical protein